MSRAREEALAAGVSVKETHHNMKRRKPWHNYHRKGTYMLTLVVEGRRPVLGRLVMPSQSTQPTEPNEPTQQLEAHVELTELGKAIYHEEILKIPVYYKTVVIWKLCIMPDHLHMIVRVKEDMPNGKHLGDVVRGFKVGCTRAWWQLTQRPAGETAGVVEKATAVGVVEKAAAAGVVEKAAAARVVEKATAAGVPSPTPAVSPAGEWRPVLFESGYNDQILLEDGQLDNWLNYLDDNPRRLAIKRLHPDYFTTMHYRDIAEWHCQLVGNSFLLDIPDKAAVIVHRAYSDAEYEEYKQQWLACGERGGVLVSASIATREKEVMREAMDRGYRLILVRENGFPPLYKPAGESFDACSEGRLLQVSPWPYHMQRRIISREQCLMLNRLVETITQL